MVVAYPTKPGTLPTLPAPTCASLIKLGSLPIRPALVLLLDHTTTKLSSIAPSLHAPTTLYGIPDC